MLNVKYFIEQYISIAKLKKIIILSIFTIVAFSSLYLGYSSYKNYINSNASKHLMELLERFHGAYSLGTTEALKEVQEEAYNLYKIHKSSDMGLFFLICSAKSSSEIMDFEKAHEVYKVVLKSMSTKNPYYNIVNLLYAQSLLFEDSNKNFDPAIELLDKIINSNDKFIKDAAIYYKGLYYFMYKSLEKAQQVWHPLFMDPAFHESIWKQRALMAQNCNISSNN